VAQACDSCHQTPTIISPTLLSRPDGIRTYRSSIIFFVSFTFGWLEAVPLFPLFLFPLFPLSSQLKTSVSKLKTQIVNSPHMAHREKQFYAENWQDYQLIDSGNGRKLERFNEKVLIRPEPLADWSPALSQREWDKLAHAVFVPSGKTNGHWESATKVAQSWELSYPSTHGPLKFNLELTKFKHVGVFPEQASNWDFIQAQLSGLPHGARILNLFAYTGGSSIAACAAGASVTHVDSIKQVVNWTRSNMELSKLDGIRWVIEDALKFIQRETKRGNKYHGIIMDPPAWGRGPKGERWKLEDQIEELLATSQKILEPKCFAIVNTYSGLPITVLHAMVKNHLKGGEAVTGQLCLSSAEGQTLITGNVSRYVR
jgi:23S rRNA (cytosine1962-C5)-methyltransferase